MENNPNPENQPPVPPVPAPEPTPEPAPEAAPETPEAPEVPTETTASEAPAEAPAEEVPVEMPVEGVPAEPAPAEEATEVSEASAPAEPAPIEPAMDDIPIPAMEDKPKKKKGALIALIIILILGALGGAAYYFRDTLKAKFAGEPKNDQTVTPAEPVPYSEMRLNGNGLNDFDLAFLRLENDSEEGVGNKVYSPLSIKYALAMLKDGSNGATKTQIENLIGDYSPKAYLNSEHRSLANAMFIREDFAGNVKDAYEETLASKYNAAVILDSFSSPLTVNNWISDKTLGIINNMLDESQVNTSTDYVLVNALAIDMNWENQLQCASGGAIGCRGNKSVFSVSYPHENYHMDSIFELNLDRTNLTFNGKEGNAAEIGVSANRYDIIKELGYDYIRTTVQSAYDKWLEETKASDEYKQYPDNYELSFDINAYMSVLSNNYGKNSASTDFLFSDNETEKVFAKNLQEYDGSTLQYVTIMPKNEELKDYAAKLSADTVQTLINNTKNADQIESYKDGVVTTLKGKIPFFKFDYGIDLMSDLKELGITDVFSTADADLSGMIAFDEELSQKPYIEFVVHKADIEFSNDGIKAAAVTAAGGMGSAGYISFDYNWDVPVEEIDLTFDKPFLFLIRDKATGEVWFVGTVYEI